jgi:hypothetical protein
MHPSTGTYSVFLFDSPTKERKVINKKEVTTGMILSLLLLIPAKSEIFHCW